MTENENLKIKLEEMGGGGGGGDPDELKAMESWCLITKSRSRT